MISGIAIYKLLTKMLQFVIDSNLGVTHWQLKL